MNLQTLFSSGTAANLLNPDDVESNRRGVISEGQKNRLNAMTFSLKGLGAMVGPLFILAFVFVFFMPELITGSMSWFSLIPMLVLGGAALGLGKKFITWWQLASRLRTDRANGVIRSTVGEISFDPKRGFIGSAAGEEYILSASHEASGLLPGVRYNFFYLPESKVVLSAEQLGEISSGQVRLALTDILALANGFTTEDLQANRNGEVTPSQQKRGLKNLLPGLIFIGVAAVIGFIFLLPMITGGSFSGDWVPVIFGGGFLVVFGGIGVYLILNVLMDYNASTPEVVEGDGRKITRRKSSGKSSRTVYYYIIGDKEFEISEKAYPALLEGFSYRAYYLPRSNRLLTLEPVTVPERL